MSEEDLFIHHKNHSRAAAFLTNGKIFFLTIRHEILWLFKIKGVKNAMSKQYSGDQLQPQRRLQRTWHARAAPSTGASEQLPALRPFKAWLIITHSRCALQAQPVHRTRGPGKNKYERLKHKRGTLTGRSSMQNSKHRCCAVDYILLGLGSRKKTNGHLFIYIFPFSGNTKACGRVRPSSFHKFIEVI